MRITLPFSTSHIYLICKTGPSLRSLDATVLVILQATLPLTHSQSVPFLLEMDSDFGNSDCSLLKPRVKTYLFSAAYYTHLLTVLYNSRPCPVIPPQLPVPFVTNILFICSTLTLI